jgi:hypothetical protein
VGAFKEISAILTFRISGQGKKLFGDGIGLWLTQFNRQQQGNLHGIDGKFVGISVIIDTFKNVEHGGKHRDVTILVNNGEEEVSLCMYWICFCVHGYTWIYPPVASQEIVSPLRFYLRLQSETTRTPSVATSMGSATMKTGTTSPSLTPPAFVSSSTRID